MLEELIGDRNRIAALTLHGLASPDRAWVLERLSTQDRNQLQVLLDELVALGVPADKRLVQEAIRSADLLATPTSTSIAASVPSLQDLGRTLDGEPDSVIAVCLGAFSSGDSGAMLAGFDPRRSDAIRALRQTLPPGATALIAAIRAAAIRAAAIERTQASEGARREA